MEQIQFEFMDTVKSHAKELLRQVQKKDPFYRITLEELIGYIHEYGEKGEEIYCGNNGGLFSRPRGTG